MLSKTKCLNIIILYFVDKLPSKNDISNLVYCVATIQEVQRLSCVAPATLLHTTMKDVSVNGYKIPKGTRMIANLTKFMNDPDVFPNPEELRPERFIEDAPEEHGISMRIKVQCIKETFIHFILL